MPIYGLVFGLESQKKIIDAHCFGDCGKIIFGSIKSDFGFLLPCRTLKEQCPCFDKEMDEPCGDVDREPLFIRKLKDKP